MRILKPEWRLFMNPDEVRSQMEAIMEGKSAGILRDFFIAAS
jgi:hypothetical protein